MYTSSIRNSYLDHHELAPRPLARVRLSWQQQLDHGKPRLSLQKLCGKHSACNQQYQLFDRREHAKMDHLIMRQEDKELSAFSLRKSGKTDDQKKYLV